MKCRPLPGVKFSPVIVAADSPSLIATMRTADGLIAFQGLSGVLAVERWEAWLASKDADLERADGTIA
jgi:hypothetical protein